jgi:hypothetical protein
MFPSSCLTILLSDENANSKADIRCPLCGERLRICRYGHYLRYRFEDDGRLAVQRYGCLNPGCPRRTFSIPPHPYLPFCRIPLCLLMAVLINHRVNKHTINRCARYLKCSWHAAKRAFTSALRLINWFLRESSAGAIPLTPCLEHTWPAFTRAYSYAFFPDRR